MMTFLGMTGFSSDWIEDYALKTAPLREIMKNAGTTNLRAELMWNADAMAAFEGIKQELQGASALATPDYTKPFLLYVANRSQGYASAEGAGKIVNIYTDSAYAHGVCHLFGAVWKMRGFKKTDGSPIMHCDQIVELMLALLLPKQVAIIKCQAHKKGNDYVTKGNSAADEAAKGAANSCGLIQAVLTMPVASPTEDDVARMQEKAGVYEHNMWLKRGAVRTPTGLWRTHDGMLLAPTALLGLLITNAHGFDHCARGEVVRKIRKQGFWSPYLQTMVDSQLNECEVCAKNNVRKTITTPLGHIPTPEGPFRHLVLDYVDMIKKVNGKRYMLVEKNRVPEPEDDPPRGVEPGDQVYLRVFRRKWNEPRREGPYKVTNATPTAIQVEGSSTWYHLNHCTKAAQPRTSQERGEETDAAAPETGSQLHDQTRLSQDEEGADAVPDPLRPGANPTGPRTDPRV
ncbi:Gag-Pol polyprotein [Merluccius polli]|uniref:Gag-Pol polyprotein n=1 Tax=Merluccius polli TaxID=89951 RepID=A0AA47NWB7_MERPO|nr:Gag-Pol polyprotein [Merluccius polli]